MYLQTFIDCSYGEIKYFLKLYVRNAHIVCLNYCIGTLIGLNYFHFEIKILQMKFRVQSQITRQKLNKKNYEVYFFIYCALLFVLFSLF